MRVLVDTSVWIAHFRQRNDALAALLEADRVLMHPMVLGKIACGTPPQRTALLRDLADLAPASQATVGEVIAFLDREHLYGRGCGLVALTLLASTILTPEAVLWTLDRRLADMAEALGVLYLAVPLH